MTSRELTSGLNFWSRGHLPMAVHLHIKFGTDIFIQSGVIVIFPKFKRAAAATLDFRIMWIWLFRRVDSVVFVLCAKFVSNICYSHWDRRTYAKDFHLMTSRELTSGFDLWSCGHLRMSVMHLHIKFGADIFIQSRVIVIFPKFKMAAAATLDFRIMWIWPFRRVDSVVFVLCAKFVSNICYSHWDRRTYAEDFHLMTSRELTSGFDLWSCGHLRMAVMHLHIKFNADIFIQSRVIVIFPKFKMAAAAMFDFQIMWICPLRRVVSMVFVLCIKFGSNMCYSHWDRRIYASDFHLMTSRELTSGFEFWSRGHIRMVAMHLPIKSRLELLTFSRS